jgi:hypothetical protein
LRETAIGGKDGVLLGHVRRIGQIDRLSPRQRDEIDVVFLVASDIRRIGDEAAIRREGGLVLPVLAPGELGRFAAHGGQLPQIEPARVISRDHQRLAVRAERRPRPGQGLEEVRDLHGPGRRIDG